MKNHWEHYENIVLTSWELIDNLLRTHWEQEENEKSLLHLHSLQTQKIHWAMLSLLIWLRYTGERRTTFAKAYRIKVRCYWEHIRNKRANETRIFFK
jgi:hypothetical protein